MIDPLTIVSEFDTLRAEPLWGAKEAPECMGRVYQALTRIFEPYLNQTYPQITIVAVIENHRGDLVLYQGPAANPSRYAIIPVAYVGNPNGYRAKGGNG